MLLPPPRQPAPAEGANPVVSTSAATIPLWPRCLLAPHTQDADEEAREDRLEAEHGQRGAGDHPPHRLAVVEIAELDGPPLHERAYEKQCPCDQRDGGNDQRLLQRDDVEQPFQS